MTAPKEPPHDPVNQPAHYTRGPVEVVDVIEGYGLDYHLGNVAKYILRAGHKDDTLQDLKKARWYLDRKITRLEETRKPSLGPKTQAAYADLKKRSAGGGKVKPARPTASAARCLCCE